MTFLSARSSIQTLLLPATLMTPSVVAAQNTFGSEAEAVSQDQTTGVVADIIVTAQRREERNQAVPISITAFSSQRLEQQNIQQPQDLQSTVPSLTIGAVGTGSRETQSFSIRGQGATFQASPGVVVYLNEVPLPSPITLSQQGGPGNFLDLESVQVLAGPQGTLFGRNTTGGAVLLVPKKPDDRLGGYLEATIGNYDNRQLEGVMNIPVVSDTLMLRAAGVFQDRDGYTRDIVWNKDRDDVHYYAGRLGILFRPGDRFENYLMVYGSKSRTNGTGNIHRGFNLDGLKGITLPDGTPTPFCIEAQGVPGAVASCDVYRNATAIATTLGPRATAMGIDEYQDTETWGVENTSKFELSDTLVVRNIASYQRFKMGFLIDADATVLQQYDTGVGRLPEGPVTVSDGTRAIGPFVYANESPIYPRDDFRTITEEIQLQGDFLDKKLQYTLGAFYFDQKPVSRQGYYSMNYCPAAFTGFCTPLAILQGVSTRSKALYAQATLDFGAITPALARVKLTSGYRQTWDRIKGFNTSFRTAGTAGAYVCSDGISTTDFTTCTFRGNLKSSAPNWLIGLDYQVTGKILLFAKVSRGYKAGGFNSFAVRPATRTFEPERVTSYEAGFKSDFHIGAVPLRLNASYYYTDYSNIQRTSGDLNLATGASGGAIRSAKAEIRGFEAEATMKPFPNLELGGNFSYGTAKYKEYFYPALVPTRSCDGTTKTFAQTVDARCLPFPFLPKFIYSFHMAADIPAPAALGDLSFFVSYAHTGAQHTENVILPPDQPGEELGGFGLLSASLDLKNIAGSGLDASLFVTNATNKLFRISNTDTYQTGSLLAWSSVYGEPRMYGLRLRYHFGER